MYIDDITRGREGWKLGAIKGGVRLNGVEVVHLTFKLPREEIQYWIDLDRGGVPLQSMQTIESGTTRTTIRIVSDDLRRVAGKAWLPFRQTMFISPRVAKQFVIQDADFEIPPAQALFHLDFPEPRPMINSASGVRYEPRKTWDLDSLPSPFAAGTKRLIYAEPGSAPELPGPHRPASWNGAVALVLGVSLLVLGCYLIVRARRSRSQ